MNNFTTLDLILKLWPLLAALVGGAFWMGILEFRVRNNTTTGKDNSRQIERQREKQQKMEVDQAGWKSTLESIKESIESINNKLDGK